MGIYGLNHFITRFEKDLCELINMPEEIEKWKEQHNGKVPTILVDLKETAQIFMQNGELNAALGGSFDFYNKRLKLFIESLRKTNAKLVFFMVGKKYTDDLQFFIPAREYTYINCLEVLDRIEGHSDAKKLVNAFRMKYKTFNCEIRMNPQFDYNLEKLVRRYGNFHVNYVQHNQEIARYAKQHADEVLAIITNDTDFMGFEGDFQFWRATGAYVKEMHCTRYCRQKLFDRLGLNFHQMHLLSALCGSKFLPIYVISDFLNGLVRANDDPIKRGKIWNVSSYIKRQPYEMVNNKAIFDLEHISRDVFGMDYSSTQLNCIANSLKIYDLDFDDKPELELNDAFLKYCKQHNIFLYKLAIDDIVNVKDIEYIDFRDFKSKSYAELIILVLMKMSGILFKDNTCRPDVRRICMKHAHDEPFKVTEEYIVYPPMQLPKLFDLIFKRREKKSDALHWSLLKWILNLDENFVEKLRGKNLSKKLSAVVITLKYLVQNEELTTSEANAILITEHKIQRFGSNKVELSKVPSIQYIRIAHLYVKLYVLVSHCLEICGLRDLTHIIQFDGPMFMKTLEEFETKYEQTKQHLNAIGLNFFTK